MIAGLNVNLSSTSYISIIYAYHNGHMFHWCRLGVQVRLVFIARAGTNTGRQPDWTYAWRDKSYAVPPSELLPKVNKKLKTILSGGWVQEQRWFSQHNPQVILLTKLVLVEEDEASAWRLHHDVRIWELLHQDLGSKVTFQCNLFLLNNSYN